MQKKVGEITANIDKVSYIVTNRGKGKILMLPYFDGCDKWIDEYMEDFEMYCNKEKLQKDGIESMKSGDSDLTI